MNTQVRLRALVDRRGQTRGSEPASIAVEGVLPTMYRGRRLAFGAHILSLGVAAAVLMYVERNQWFFYDEWDFLARRGVHLGDFGLFWGHSEHWSTIPILIYRTLAHTVGLRSYAPYMAVLVVLHLALAHFLWRCTVRAGADPWIAGALVAVFLVLGAGANNLDWAFQIGFVGALAAGMLALLLADRDGPLRWLDLRVVVVLLIALMFSGIGVTVTVMVGLAAWARRGLRVALGLTVVPALAYVVWETTAARSASMFPPTRSELLKVPDYVWAGLTQSAEAVTGLAGAGGLLVVGLVVLLVRGNRRVPTRAAAAYAAGAGAVVFYLITAVGRIHLGIQFAGSTRYVYIACALSLPAMGIVLSDFGSRSRLALGVLLAFVAGALVHNVDLLLADARLWSATKAPPKQVILASARALATEPVIADPETLPEPTWSPDLHLDVLRRMWREGWLPPLPVPDTATHLLVALRLEVTVTSEPRLPVSHAPSVEAGYRAIVTRLPGGCFAVRGDGGAPQIRLLLGGSGSVQVVPGADGVLSLLYAERGRLDEQAGPAVYPVLAGRTVYVSLSAPNAAPAVTLPGGVTRLCGA